jgi:DNA-directed RNA polymerase specialized sigma24 family protein
LKTTKPIKTAELSEDFELLEIMSWREDPDYEAEARKSFDKFYKRHQETFMAVCRGVCSKVAGGGDELANAVFFNTMKRVYERAGSMLKGLEKYREGKGVLFEDRLDGYLNKMAQNELADLLKEANEHKEQVTYMDNEEVVAMLIAREEMEQYEADEDVEIVSTEMAALEKALANLSEKEQDILLTYYRYADGKKYLPREVKTMLGERYGLLPGTLHVNKARSEEKLINMMKSYLKA